MDISELEPRPYYSERAFSTAFYDWVTAHDRSLAGDSALYASLAPRRGRVLEYGSGTGRIAHALAALGFVVTGLEQSAEMIAQAEKKRTSLPRHVAVRASYVLGDMRTARLGSKFDLVIGPFFVLAHVEPKEWPQVFSSAAAHLEPGGVAAFHMPRAELMRVRPAVMGAPVLQGEAADGRALSLSIAHWAFRGSRLDLDMEYALTTDGRPLTSRERITLFSDDPTPAASAAGFVLDRLPVQQGAGDIYVYRLT
jgi:SAM-dependent methyltransferase